MCMTIFKDRRDAGRKLTEKLASYRGTDAIVVALPRGGVVVGHEIACDLSLPLDIVAVRKVGHPASPEYAIGAVDEYGTHIVNKEEVAQVDEAWLEREIESEVKEARRRSLLYRKGLDILDLAGRIVIVTDDGIATGYTMEVALMAIKKHWPRKIIVAVPIAPPDIARRLMGEVDKFVTLTDPNEFRGAVGSHYGEFEQVDDDEVVGLLHSSSLLERSTPASA